jgi:hypothetical protein
MMVREAKPDLRRKELTREVAYERPFMAERLSRSPSKLLDIGGKERARRLVSKQPSLSWTGRIDRGYMPELV